MCSRSSNHCYTVGGSIITFCQLQTRRKLDALKFFRQKFMPSKISGIMVDHFTVFKSFPSTSYCSQKFPPNVGWMCEVVSGIFTLGGWQLGDGFAGKVEVQNCGKALVKPKKPAWRGCAGSLMAEM